MTSLGKMKRGDTFSFYAKIKDASGDPLALAADKITSQVRGSSGDTLYADLTVAESATVGTYLFTALPVVTVLWPDGEKLLIDIQMDDDDVISSTETFSVKVLKDITH